MPSPVPPVVLFLLHRDGLSRERQTAAWREALAQDAVVADVQHVWAGEGPVPAGMDLGSLTAATAVLDLSDDTVALVAEAVAVPGPHVVRRLVDTLLEAPGRLVDARVLPVELTRTDGRPRGYGLADGADPTAEVLEESRHAWDAPTSEQDPIARATGACCALRAGDLAALGEAFLAPAPERGSRLRAAAEAGDVPLVVATTAAVSLPVRLGWDVAVDGLVTALPDRVVPWAPSTHPAELPATSLGALAGQLRLRPAEPAHDDVDPDAPFLSIVTRTQGRRLSCLEDVLTCLAGQSDRDFELLVVCHRTTPDELAAVEGVLASAPDWLRDAVRVLPVERPGRAAPLNDGFAAARGRYVVALDDDDTVLAHYVATFKAAAAEHEGRLLRAVAVRQDVVPRDDAGDVLPISVGDPYREWPLDFSLVDHLSDNYSPIMSVAFPRGAVHGLGLRFDETLQANEDWEYVVRCAAVLGVVSVREITSVYRWWLHTASSREAHTADEWDEARSRIQSAVTGSVLLLQPEETRRIVATLQRSRRDLASAHELAEATAAAQHATNVEMETVARAHDEAVAGRDLMVGRLADVEAELSATRAELDRRAHQLRRLELVQEVQQRIDDGTLERPEKPLTDMTLARLTRLAEAPVVLVRRSRLGRR
ncbi:glycosyltransferase family 2 protein [Nocardioides hwasunensis]|uniref:Glycosyltransferase n=1 Tax=Nocardioides hwasunensis TaxID=397258 RepID=A0ABR8MRD0_9ACTN|nr:glycosyltransferase [Nocardioides hwasunensis]MBD3916654.1 glycosyltransferase [Nocardioides hwasunensis]